LKIIQVTIRSLTRAVQKGLDVTPIFNRHNVHEERAWRRLSLFQTAS
jgi:hypothetical protein